MGVKMKKVLIICIEVIFIYSNIVHAETMHLRVPSFSQRQGTINISEKSPEDSLETKKSLHIGCGGTPLIYKDVNSGFEVTVVDISEDAIEFQKEIDRGYSKSGNKLPAYICMDASKFDKEHGFKNDSFDKITILNVFDVFSGHGREAVIKNILNLIVEGGVILATNRGEVYSYDTEASNLLEEAKKQNIIIEKISGDMKPYVIGGTYAVYKILKKPKKATDNNHSDIKCSL